MVLPKGPFWEYVKETGESRQCTFCGHPFSKLTPITRFKLHWSGVQRRGTTICDKVPQPIRDAAFTAVDGPPEKKLKTTATSSNDGAHSTISTSLLEQNSQVGNVVNDVETEPELYFPSPGEREFVQTNKGNFQLDRVSSFPRDPILGEQVEQECERNTQDNLPLFVEDYRIEGMITAWNQLVVRGGSPERLTVNEDEPRGDSSQPGGLQCLGLRRNYDQQCSSSVNNDVNNDLCPSKKKHKATAGSSNNEVTDVISASAQEQNNKVMAQQGEALSDNEFEEWIASIPVEELTLRHSSPEELLPNEFQTAPRTERAHQDCEGRTSDISSLFMEDNVISNSIENTTIATGLMQHSERGRSHERLSINQVETHGDSTHPTDLPCLDLGIHYDQLCPSSLNNDVIRNDLEKMIRESGQLVVRGSSHEGPLVNCDEPQGDSSQPTDPLCLTHGRYHDQLCSPLVNMVGDPGQPGAGASFSGGLTCNTDAIKGDAVPTTKLVGQAFKDHEKTIWSWLMHDEVSTIGIYGMGGVGKTALVKHIYDQLQERRDSFCHVYWITASQDTSISRLQNSIARRIGLDLSNEDEELYRASDLSKELMKKQKWVLILDDLWKAFELHKVGVPIQAVKGCKLILTTRSEKVCEQMDTPHKIKVSPILEEEAWNLFIERLGHQMALSPEVKPIAKSITKECGGLPLGIKTMAGTMKGVEDIHEWRNALEDLRESRVRKDDMEPDVFHILRYSYNHLSEEVLQQCFLYCALFPEDFEILREDLIAHLIDEGVMKRLNSREAEFDKGHSMLNKLENACLLEGAEMYGGRSYVKMHDLIRDMAIQILQENSQGMVKAGAQLRELPSVEEWTDNLTRVSLMHNQIEKIPSGHSPRCPSLSTLLLCGNPLVLIADSFFEQLRGLKVLDLSHTDITELPDSVSELVNLTALLLIGCYMLRHVPSLEKLRALKRLDLSGIRRLEKMPEGMECLHNLRYLRMNGCGEKEFPRGLLPKLSHLQVFVLEEWIPPATKDNRKGQYAPITVKGKEVGCLRELESLECHFEGYSEYVEYLKSRDETQSLSRYQIAVGLLDDDYLFGRSKTIFLSNLSVNKDGDFQVMFPKDIQQLNIYKCDDQPCHNLGRYPNQLGTSQVNMVREPVQPVVRDSSREVLQRNGGARASSSGGLTGNTNETSGDPLPTSLHVEVDNVAPQGQHPERVSGQPVVRGSSHERPLVNHDEPQEDSSQPTDPPCLTHGRYHDQLCPPLVNMVRDPGQPVVRDSSRNGDESGRDVFLTKELVGRGFENNKNTIWLWIMSDEASSSIGICGMGGVGKTTLLTHIYNQLLQEPDTFPHVYWITVSQDFSVYKLQNLIAKDVHLDLSNEDNERKRAAKLSKALIGKQRWVLILDDLWDCFDFNEVGIPIQVKGWKLILATRSLDVCQRMSCQNILRVAPLSVEEAWALFIKILGCISPGVEEIAKSMVRECVGLPLGIKTVAGTMRGVDDICEWRNALEELKQSRVWQEDMFGGVYKILRFSYMHLKESALQQCFLYCALFPEDFDIRRDDLIAYLIDEGVIKGLKSREAEFNKGHSMLNILERVWLLESAKNRYNDERYVKMHDLIRDMAIQILEDNSQGMVKAGAQLREFPGAEEWTKNLTRVSLMHNQIEEIPSRHSPRCPSLSTLLLCYNHGLRFIADSFFEQLHGLKILDMSRTNITKLPDSVFELVSLTALLLTDCNMLRHVPSIEKLRALRRLDLSGTALEKIPQGMECLCNLRYLRMNGCGEKEFPRGLLPKLSHLQVFVLEEWIPPTTKDNRKGQYAPITVKGKEVGCLRELESLECHFEGYSEYMEYLKSRDETQSLSRYQIAVGLLLDDDYLFGRSKTILLSNLSVNKDGDFQVMFPKDIQQLTIYKCDDATGEYMD